MSTDNNSKGIVLIIIAMTLFAMQDSLIKFIFEKAALYEIFFGRYFVAAILLFCYIKFKKQNVSLIFLSSIFKRNKNYLGIYRFKILQSLTIKKVIALGGISKENEKKIRMLSCEGISGISYFE